MAKKTWLGDRLKPLNSDIGKASPGWGTTPIMGALIASFGVFLIIILQIANNSLILDGVNDSVTTGPAANGYEYKP
jgi:photosystem II PsbH protein